MYVFAFQQKDMIYFHTNYKYSTNEVKKRSKRIPNICKQRQGMI